MLVTNANATAARTAAIPNLSGTYDFHGSLEAHHEYFRESGTLTLDWLGDVSGEACMTPEPPIRALHNICCDTLIVGSYFASPNPGVSNATLTVTPVTAGCRELIGRRQTYRVNIIPGNKPNEVDLVQQSGEMFGALAWLESRGPS